MKNELYVFTLPGLAGIVMLKSKTTSILKIVPEDNNEEDVSMQSITNRTKKEIKRLTNRKTVYNTINTGNRFDQCSNLL